MEKLPEQTDCNKTKHVRKMKLTRYQQTTFHLDLNSYYPYPLRHYLSVVHLFRRVDLYDLHPGHGPPASLPRRPALGLLQPVPRHPGNYKGIIMSIYLLCYSGGDDHHPPDGEPGRPPGLRQGHLQPRQPEEDVRRQQHGRGPPATALRCLLGPLVACLTMSSVLPRWSIFCLLFLTLF